MGISEKLGISASPWWSSGNEVGTVPMMMTKICKVHFTAQGEKDKSDANAQLIATAPEMLECLIESITLLDQTIDFFDLEGFGQQMQLHIKIRDKNILLIEKATNKSWKEIKELICK